MKSAVRVGDLRCWSAGLTDEKFVIVEIVSGRELYGNPLADQVVIMTDEGAEELWYSSTIERASELIQSGGLQNAGLSR